MSKLNSVSLSDNRLTVVRVQGRIADQRALDDLADLVYECENLYPGIDLWFKRRVSPGFRDGTRVGFLVYEGEKPAAGAIIKISSSAKVCSLRVRSEYASRGIGTALFGLAAHEIRSLSDSIHFTAPEGLVVEEGGYFRQLGFQMVGTVPQHYRPGQDEFAFAGQTSRVLERTQPILSHTLFGADVNAGSSGYPWLVMSIHPKFIEKILRGEKVIELRRKFLKSYAGCHVLMYSTSPQQAIVATARIAHVDLMRTAVIAQSLLPQAGCTVEELSEYSGDIESLWAISLENVQPLVSPLHLKDLRKLLNTPLYPPMSYGLAKSGSGWGRVVNHIAMTYSFNSI